MNREELEPVLQQLIKGVQADLDRDVGHASDLANGAAQWLMDRADMIDANPFLCWVIMLKVAEVNLAAQRKLLISPEKVSMLSRVLKKPSGEVAVILEDMIDRTIKEITESGRMRSVEVPR